MPPAATKSNMAKIYKSYILTPPHPQGHVMSVKCEEPIDELTVQVWLLYHHPNFKYCTLLVSGTELRTDGRTDRQTDGQTDDPITRCPRRTFQARGIKRIFKKNMNSPIDTIPLAYGGICRVPSQGLNKVISFANILSVLCTLVSYSR